MRLAFVGPVHPYRGGIAHFVARLAKEISATDDCLVINFTRLYPDFLFPGKTQYDESKAEIGFPSSRIISSVNPLTWKLAAKQISDWKADALIFHYWHPFFGPAFRSITSSLHSRIPTIAICHNVVPHDASRVQKFLSRYGLAGMSGYIVHAKSEVNDLEALVHHPIHRIAFHPIYDVFPGSELSQDEARARLNLDPTLRLVLNFGLIRNYKGVDLLLEAAALLKDIPRLRVLVVGEIYEGKDQLEGILKTLPAGLAELRNEYVSNEDVALYFRAADLIALPYRTATQSGIISIAYACGRPVLATNVGGLPDVVIEGESGYLVPPENPYAISEAIRAHFKSEGKRDMSDGIATMRNRLSWSRYADLLKELIEEVTPIDG